MAEIGKVWVTVGAKIDELEKALNVAKKELGDTKDEAEKANTGFKSLWAQMAAGVIAAGLIQKGFRLLTDTLKDSIKEAAESERIERGLNAALELTGRTLPGMADHMKRYASELQKLTGYEDDSIIKTQSLLVQLTNLNQDGLDAATRGAIGLANVFGMNLDSAARAVAQAMEGNYVMMGRYIPALKSATTEGEKHAILLDNLEKLYQRTTQETDTYSGAVRKLESDWSNAKEELGKAVLSTNILQSAMEGLTLVIKGVSGETAREHKKATEDQIEANNKAYEALRKMGDEIGWSSVKIANLATQYRLSYVQLQEWIAGNMFGETAAKALSSAVDEQNKKLEGGKKGFSETGKAASSYSETLTNTLVPALREMAGIQMFATDSLKDAYYAMTELANTAIPAARDAWKAFNYEAPAETKIATEEMSSKWDDLMRDITRGMSDTIVELIDGNLSLKDALEQIWEDIKKAFIRTLVDVVMSEFEKVLKGVISGTSSMASTVTGTLSGIGTAISTLATSIGTILTTLATAIATGIVTLATGIASAITILATAIATAATTLAAAAPELLAVGLVAAAIYTAFLLGSTLVDALGGILDAGGKQTDVTYWLKMLKDLGQEDHDRLRDITNWLFNEAWPVFYTARDLIGDIKSLIDEIRNGVNSIESKMGVGSTSPDTGILIDIRRILGDIESWESHIYAVLRDVTKLGAGGIVTTPTLAFVGESGPEAVIPLASGMRGGSALGTVNVNIYAQTLDDRTIQKASERIYAAMERESRRRGY